MERRAELDAAPPQTPTRPTSAPRHRVASEGLPITSFRLASTQRRYDRGAQKWIDAETNWYTITCFRQLAINVVGSLSKGQRVLITGSLRVRDWESGDRAGTTVEVDADAIGHDLSYGSSVFTRAVAVVSESADDDTAAVTGPVAVEVDGTIVADTEHITPA